MIAHSVLPAAADHAIAVARMPTSPDATRGPSLAMARDALNDALKCTRSEGREIPGVDARRPGIRELLSALGRFAMCRLKPQAANGRLCEVEVLSS